MKTFLLLFLLMGIAVHSQNTMSFSEETVSPNASISQIEWMTGHWKGEAFGGITEEIWSPPLGGSMMFSFKLVADDKVNFYELGHILETNGTLLLQLKHFGGDLKGWEEKNDTVDFKLVKVDVDRLYFDDFTFERISDQEVNLYVVVGEEDGSQNEVKFNYKRQ